MFFTELCLLPLVGIAILFARVDFNPKTPVKDQEPILLIHGSSFNQGQWLIIRFLLKRWGYRSVYSLNMDDHILKSTKSLQEYVDTVSEFTKKILKDTEQKKITIIGHSLGGIVAGGVSHKTNKVKKIISINSPWCGSDFIKTFFNTTRQTMSQIHKDLMPGAEPLTIICDSAIEKDKFSVCDLYCIGSELDFIVPPCSAIPFGLIDQVCVLQYTGHYAAIINPTCLVAIRNFLKR